MIDVEEHERSTGWRGVFLGLPATRNTAQKIMMPLGYFYSPFIADAETMKTSPLMCAKCKASICPYSTKNKNTKSWTCSFCPTTNPLPVDIGNNQVEEYVEAKVGENGLFFIIDLCVPAIEL